MEREELIKRVEAITNLKTQYKELYAILDELGIKYKKTVCMKCRKDYLYIVKEELGMIENAAEHSDFNGGKWVYLRDRSFSWTMIDGKKVIINANTPQNIIEEFVKEHKGFYKQTDNNE